VRFYERVVAGYFMIAATFMSCSKEVSKPATKLPIEESQSSVLPESTAQSLAQQCSRSGPPRFDKTWRPGLADVEAMESRLDQISLLRAIAGKRIENPSQYRRQYVGIVVGGRKLIYINAFCSKPQDFVVEKRWSDWRKDPVEVCDGGDCFWGAVYDVLSSKFSDLQVNGVA
jgi:hypothetical protein